jgi:hypothetical protein
MDETLNHDLQSSCAEPEVALVFPPLVETNFGYYFPSTAVLAGYLLSLGAHVTQTDLNEDFATYLLKPDVLERLAVGILGGGNTISPCDMAAVAARTLKKRGSSLIDPQGKHLFRDDSSGLAYLLKLLVKPFRIDEPLGITGGASLFSRPGVEVYREFFEQSGFAEGLSPSVEIIGISVSLGPQLVPALIFSRYIKERLPELRVVFGGSAVSLMQIAHVEKILSSYPEVDALVRFDGERPLSELFQQIRAGDWQPSTVPGISCRLGKSIVHKPPVAGPELDTLPFAHYDPVILSRLAVPELGIVQSRGCYWGRCAYCDYVELYGGSRRYRTRAADCLVREMEYQIRQHAVDRFSIITESIPPTVAGMLSQLILDNGLKVKWHSFAMVDRRFTRDLLKRMVAAGCEFLIVGAETLVDRLLRLMNKAATRADTIQFLRHARAAGLDINVNLIPDLPSTTREEALESLERLDRLRDCFNFVSVFPFEATRSSGVGRELEKYGLSEVNMGGTGQAQFKANHIEVVDPAMSQEQRCEVLKIYQDFAWDVNNRSMLETASAQVEAGDGVLMSLADDILDIVKIEYGFQCFNRVTREKFDMPPECGALIEKMRSQRQFSLNEFMQWFPLAETAEFYLGKFIEKKMLVLAGHD